MDSTTDAANTEMSYDVIESTFMPEDPAQPEAEPESEPALETPKPLAKKKGRPASTKDGYKRQRKSCTTNRVYTSL